MEARRNHNKVNRDKTKYEKESEDTKTTKHHTWNILWSESFGSITLGDWPGNTEGEENRDERWSTRALGGGGRDKGHGETDDIYTGVIREEETAEKGWTESMRLTEQETLNTETGMQTEEDRCNEHNNTWHKTREREYDTEEGTEEKPNGSTDDTLK